MKVIYALTIILFSLTLCHAQDSNGSRRVPDEAYTRQLIRLLTGLQKNPWVGWESGTEVVLRYLVDSNAAGTPLGHAQPDIVFKVLEADKVLITMQVYKGKSIRRVFEIKDQPGLDAAWPRVIDPSTTGPRTTDQEIDGFRLSCLLSELTMHTFPGGTMVSKEWTLASHPSIVVGKEAIGSNGWRVTSAQVIKQIGEREFTCVEVKKWMRFYHHGPYDAMTTQYLCPDVPGYLVEEIMEYFKVKKGQRSSAPDQVVHQKVVELKLQKPRRH
jgi:hypothetical protein